MPEEATGVITFKIDGEPFTAYTLKADDFRPATATWEEDHDYIAIELLGALATDLRGDRWVIGLDVTLHGDDLTLLEEADLNVEPFDVFYKTSWTSEPFNVFFGDDDEILASLDVTEVGWSEDDGDVLHIKGTFGGTLQTRDVTVELTDGTFDVYEVVPAANVF